MNGRLKGWVLALAIAAPLLPAAPAGALPPAGHAVDGRVEDWTATSPLVGGASVMSDGEFLYQDYLFDDAGTEAGSPSNANNFYYRGISAPVGDVLYPNEVERCRNNCADLLEFRAALDGDRVHFLVRLNTLLTPDSTVAAIALGPAGDDGGEPHPWPFLANVATPGTRHVLTVWGTGGAFDDADLASVGGEVAVDVEANAIEVSVPAALVGSRFRAYVGTGLWDAGREQWQAIHQVRTYTEPGLRQAYDGIDVSTPESPPRDSLPRVFNLAFRAGEVGNWFENAQGAALAKGDVSAFHADIDLQGPDRTAEPFVAGAWVQRMYSSSVTIPPGEGVYANFPAVQGRGLYCCAPAGVPVPTRFHFLGERQPYALYVPEGGYDRAILANHPGLTSHGASTTSAGYAQLAEAANAVMVTPLARGVISFCTDYAHLDVLEAWDDALSLFPHGPRGGQDTPGSFVDTDRNMLWGYSMGGLCAARLAVLHPDEFASAVQWAASTALQEDHEPADSAAGHPANGNELDLMQNTRGVTWRINHCVPDEIAYYNGAASHAQRLEELGYVYNFRSLFGGEHLTCGIGGFAEDAEGTAAAVIDHDPPRVTYTTEEGWWRPDISPRLVFDHAYWVSGLRTREQSEPGENLTAFGTVDAVTHGLRGERAFATSPYGLRAGVSGWPYEERGRAAVQGAPLEEANAFEATLTNLRAATFDLERMGLSIRQELTATLSTDGPGAVTLAGAAKAPLLACDPSPCPTTRSEGDDMVVALPAAGAYSLVFGAAPVDVERVEGSAGAVGAAIAVSRDAFKSAATVVLGRADLYADSLAGGPLAAQEDAPILLTDAQRLSAETEAEIERLGPQRVLILGGTAAVSAEVEQALRDKGLDVQRFAGVNRWQTAALIAADLGSATGGVFLAEGGNADPNRGWPDSMAASAYAAFRGDPILLVEADRLPDETSDALDGLGVSRAVIVGGTVAVGQRVEEQVAAGGLMTRRLAGETRYGTSQAVYLESVEAGMDPSVLWLATGLDWPNALVSGPVAGAAGQTFALLDGHGGPDTKEAILTANLDQLRLVRLVGDQAAISAEVQAQVNQIVNPQRGP